MKNAAYFVVAFLLCSSSVAQRPGPPGLDQGQRTVGQGEKNVPPPLYERSRMDPAQLKREAAELVSLAQSVPPSIDQTTKGMFPKDLTDRLKKIEKLAKQLRSQISQ